MGIGGRGKRGEGGGDGGDEEGDGDRDGDGEGNGMEKEIVIRKSLMMTIFFTLESPT